MPNLSASQLTQMRSQREASFQSTCRIDTITQAVSGASTWTEGSTVSCGITTPSSRPDGGGGLVTVSPDDRGYLIAMPYGTSVKGSDRIVSNGVTYEVLAVDKPGGFGVQVTCRCVEILT